MTIATLAKGLGLATIAGCGASTVFAQTPCTSAQDVSYKASPDRGCKSFDWVLQFTYVYNGSTYYGGFPAYTAINGACLGNYTTCNGQYVSESKLEGTKYMQYNIGFETISVQWQVNQPYRNMVNCQPWENPNGKVEVVNWQGSLQGWNQAWCN